MEQRKKCQIYVSLPPSYYSSVQNSNIVTSLPPFYRLSGALVAHLSLGSRLNDSVFWETLFRFFFLRVSSGSYYPKLSYYIHTPHFEIGWIEYWIKKNHSVHFIQIIQSSIDLATLFKKIKSTQSETPKYLLPHNLSEFWKVRKVTRVPVQKERGVFENPQEKMNSEGLSWCRSTQFRRVLMITVKRWESTRVNPVWHTVSWFIYSRLLLT